MAPSARLVLVFLLVLFVARGAAAREAERPRAILALDPTTLEGPKAEDVRVAFTIWLDEILKDAGLTGRMEAIVLDDDASVVDAVRQRRGDIFILNSLRYLRLAGKLAFLPAVVNERSGGFGDAFVLLARKESKRRSLAALRGGRLGICTAGKGAIPRLWLDVILAEAGLDPESHWRSVKEGGQASKIVLPVFFGQADVAVVTAAAYEILVELNPQIGRELEVIRRSEVLLDTVSVWRGDYEDRELREAFDRHIRRIGQLERGRQFLTLYRVKEIHPYEERHLDSLRRLLARAREVLPAGGAWRGMAEDE